MTQIREFLAVSRDRKWSLLVAVGCLCVAVPGVKGTSIERVRRFLSLGAIPIQEGTAVADIGWAIDVVGNQLPFQVRCLPAALAAEALLDAAGYCPEFNLGVTRDEPGSIEAHAWTNVDGQTVVGEIGELSRYEKFHQ